jgi:hypothetical protein
LVFIDSQSENDGHDENAMINDFQLQIHTEGLGDSLIKSEFAGEDHNGHEYHHVHDHNDLVIGGDTPALLSADAITPLENKLPSPINLDTAIQQQEASHAFTFRHNPHGVEGVIGQMDIPANMAAKMPPMGLFQAHGLEHTMSDASTMSFVSNMSC